MTAGKRMHKVVSGERRANEEDKKEKQPQIPLRGRKMIFSGVREGEVEEERERERERELFKGRAPKPDSPKGLEVCRTQGLQDA
jgi:hypothetical protein